MHAGELPISLACRRCDAGSEVLQRLFGELLYMQLYQRTRCARKLSLAFVNNVKEWLKAPRTLKKQACRLFAAWCVFSRRRPRGSFAI